MLFDRVADTLDLVRLQRVIAGVGIANVAFYVLLAGLAAVAVDYAWMIYLHYRMVRPVFLISVLSCC